MRLVCLSVCLCVLYHHIIRGKNSRQTIQKKEAVEEEKEVIQASKQVEIQYNQSIHYSLFTAVWNEAV